MGMLKSYFGWRLMAFLWMSAFSFGQVVQSQSCDNYTTNRQGCEAVSGCDWCYWSCHPASDCPKWCSEAKTQLECLSIIETEALYYVRQTWPGYSNVSPWNSAGTASAVSGTYLTTWNLNSYSYSQAGSISTKPIIPTTKTAFSTIESEFDFKLSQCTTYCSDGIAFFIADATLYDGSQIVNNYGYSSQFGVVGLNGLWMAAVFDGWSAWTSGNNTRNYFYVVKSGETATVHQYPSIASRFNYINTVGSVFHVKIRLEFDATRTAKFSLWFSYGTQTEVLANQVDLSYIGAIPANIRMGISVGTAYNSNAYGVWVVSNIHLRVNGEDANQVPCEWKKYYGTARCTSIWASTRCSQYGKSNATVCNEAIEYPLFTIQGNAKLDEGNPTSAILTNDANQCGEIATENLIYTTTPFTISFKMQFGQVNMSQFACVVLSDYSSYNGGTSIYGCNTPTTILNYSSSWLGICILSDYSLAVYNGYNNLLNVNHSIPLNVSDGSFSLQFSVDISNKVSILGHEFLFSAHPGYIRAGFFGSTTTESVNIVVSDIVTPASGTGNQIVQRCHHCILDCLDYTTACGSLCEPNCDLCNASGCINCAKGSAGYPVCYPQEDIYCYKHNKTICLTNPKCQWCSIGSSCQPSNLNCSKCGDLDKNVCVSLFDDCKWDETSNNCTELYTSVVESCSKLKTDTSCNALVGCIWCTNNGGKCYNTEEYDYECKEICYTHTNQTTCANDTLCSWCDASSTCILLGQPCSICSNHTNMTLCTAASCVWCPKSDYCTQYSSQCVNCGDETKVALCGRKLRKNCNWCELLNSCHSIGYSGCHCDSKTDRISCTTTSSNRCKWCLTQEKCIGKTAPCTPCYLQLNGASNCSGNCINCESTQTCIPNTLVCPSCNGKTADNSTTTDPKYPMCTYFDGCYACADGSCNDINNLPWDCFPEIKIPSSSSPIEAFPGWIIAVIVVGSIIGLVLIAGIFFALLFFVKKSSKKNKRKSINSSLDNNTSGIALVGKPSSSKATPTPNEEVDISSMSLVNLDSPELGITFSLKSVNFDDDNRNGVPVDQLVVKSFMATLPPPINGVGSKHATSSFAFLAPQTNPLKCVLAINPQTIPRFKEETTISVSLTFNCTTSLDAKIIVANNTNKCYALLPIVATAAMSTKLDIDEFRIDHEIGHGAFGTVKKGSWRKTDVAIKELPKTLLTSTEFREEFEREVRILSSIRSPYIVCFYGTLETPDISAIVMEFCELGSLEKILRAETKMSSSLKIKIALDCAQGMQTLHSNGILHRDLKPDNLLVVSLSRSAPVRVKLTDFGTSRAVADAEVMAKYTKGVGTPLFMAPEILNGKPYSLKADVYSFSILLWELITGEVPFADILNNFALITHITEGKRLPLPQDFPQMTALIEACWAPDPDQRPNFDEIVSRLHSMKKE